MPSTWLLYMVAKLDRMTAMLSSNMCKTDVYLLALLACMYLYEHAQKMFFNTWGGGEREKERERGGEGRGREKGGEREKELGRHFPIEGLGTRRAKLDFEL